MQRMNFEGCALTICEYLLGTFNARQERARYQMKCRVSCSRTLAGLPVIIIILCISDCAGLGGVASASTLTSSAHCPPPRLSQRLPECTACLGRSGFTSHTRLGTVFRLPQPSQIPLGPIGSSSERRCAPVPESFRLVHFAGSVRALRCRGTFNSGTSGGGGPVGIRSVRVGG
jgi:hypothetical protein